MDIEIVREALSAQEYLRQRGVVADLVVVNERASSYAQDMQHAIDAMCENLRRGQPEGARQHVFAVRRDLMEESTWLALLAAARVVFHARNGKIVDQVNRTLSLFATPRLPEGIDAEWPGLLPQVPALIEPAANAAPDASDLTFWNGFGGFAEDGREYVVRLNAGQSTPAPWVNVISNARFGFHIAAEGGAFTWSRNSRDYQLTSWSNDAVMNRPGEAFYVVDLDSGEVFSPFAALDNNTASRFETRHGLGYSTFVSRHNGLTLELTVTVDREAPVKLARLTIRNEASEARRFRAYGYVEWVLGNNAQKTAPFVLTSHDAETGALFATNPYSIDYSGRTAFFATSTKAGGFTASRREFIGRNGTIRLPQAIALKSPLSNSADAEGDPAQRSPSMPISRPAKPMTSPSSWVTRQTRMPPANWSRAR